MKRPLMISAAGLMLLSSAIARADQFESLDGPVLARFVKANDVRSLKQICSNAVLALPALLKESRSGLLVARTAQGNYARLLIVPERRKSPTGKGEPFPVLVLERFDTFDGANTGSRLVKGREIVLFDGFQVDLDSGQVVPDGQGGDLRFVAQGENAPRLETIGDAKLYAPTTLPALEAGAAPQPTPGRIVVPGDFSGRYRLFANGQWSGTLDITVDTKGVVSGQFRSDLHGSAYPVTGQVADDAPHRVRFAVKFPRSQQDFDGYLWTDGKGAMAGTVSLLDHDFGFFAIRDGGRVAPDAEIHPLQEATGKDPSRVVIDIAGESIAIEGNAVSRADLATTLSKAQPKPAEVTIRASNDTRYDKLHALISVVRDAEISTIRLGIKPVQK